MRCSEGRAQLAWRPGAVGDILGVRWRSQDWRQQLEIQRQSAAWGQWSNTSSATIWIGWHVICTLACRRHLQGERFDCAWTCLLIRVRERFVLVAVRGWAFAFGGLPWLQPRAA